MAFNEQCNGIKAFYFSFQKRKKNRCKSVLLNDLNFWYYISQNRIYTEIRRTFMVFFLTPSKWSLLSFAIFHIYLFIQRVFFFVSVEREERSQKHDNQMCQVCKFEWLFFCWKKKQDVGPVGLENLHGHSTCSHPFHSDGFRACLSSMLMSNEKCTHAQRIQEKENSEKL